MKAIILKELGSTDNLILEELPTPAPKEGEVLIQTDYISINPVDIKTRAGKAFYAQLKADPPVILGWDVSGVVTAVGEGVTDFEEGDEVFGMVNFPGHGRAYAAYVTAPAAHLA